MRLSTITILAAAMAVAPAAAEDEHRELGAHEHGHGTFNIAVENNRVSMELEVPGMDIVGFEYAAKTSEQKSAVEKATGVLAEPLALFKLPAAAGCKVADAKVTIDVEQEDGDEDQASGSKEKGAEHAKEEHDEDEGKEGHNEFHASYTLDCAKPVNLTSIEFDYFKSFAGAHDLTVNVVTAKAQNSYEVSRDKPALDLGGMM